MATDSHRPGPLTGFVFFCRPGVISVQAVNSPDIFLWIRHDRADAITAGRFVAWQPKGAVCHFDRTQIQ